MAPRISGASLRTLQSYLVPPVKCCSQCQVHRSVALQNLRNHITNLREIRSGRRHHLSTATAASVETHSNDGYIHAPSITPTTSINASPLVSRAHQELYRALENLGRDAANFVGISRLGLALSGLQDKGQTLRIAVLSTSGDVRSVRRLVRLLVADPLGDEEAWERELADSSNEGESVLLRYGENGDAIQSSSQIRTLSVPSKILKRHNVEILISSLQLETSPSEFGPSGKAHDAILVPGFNAQSTSIGRFSHMTYPVHKTLLVGEGLKSLIEYGKFTATLSAQSVRPEMVNFAIKLPNASFDATKTEDGRDNAILDVENAEKALQSIRQSISNATAWEKTWLSAGIAALTRWMFRGTTPTTSGELKAPIQQLVESILQDADSSLAVSESVAEVADHAATFPESTGQDILQATTVWSEAAHSELRNQLDVAFASRNWAKLKWYKLFYRSDDVAMILSEIMEQKWLVDAEKGSIYLAGRVTGAGLGHEIGALQQSENFFDQEVANDAKPQTPRAIGELEEPSVEVPTPKIPMAYPQTIPLARLMLSHTTIPSLQALSQSLVLQTGTGMSITAAISALAYFGVTGTTLFEAGAVFAFGVVVNLKRLQSKWEAAREYWQNEVREEGRKALKETQTVLRRAVEHGATTTTTTTGVVDDIAFQDREAARRAIEKVRVALKNIQ